MMASLLALFNAMAASPRSAAATEYFLGPIGRHACDGGAAVAVGECRRAAEAALGRRVESLKEGSWGGAPRGCSYFLETGQALWNAAADVNEERSSTGSYQAVCQRHNEATEVVAATAKAAPKAVPKAAPKAVGTQALLAASSGATYDDEEEEEEAADGETDAQRRAREERAAREAREAAEAAERRRQAEEEAERQRRRAQLNSAIDDICASRPRDRTRCVGARTSH